MGITHRLRFMANHKRIELVEHCLLLAISSLLIVNLDAIAEPKSLTSANSLRAIEHRTKIPLPGPRFARIIDQSFSKAGSGFGIWRGKVSGNGEINLDLQIVRGREVVATYYMGHVFISPNKKPTQFAYKTLLPKGSDWAWKIRASAS